jgi:hypothetical protein
MRVGRSRAPTAGLSATVPARARSGSRPSLRSSIVRSLITDWSSSVTSRSLLACASLCLIKSQSFSPRDILTSVQEPFSLRPRIVIESLPSAMPRRMRCSASERSPNERPPSSGEYVPLSQTITWPAPYSFLGMMPSKEP